MAENAVQQTLFVDISELAHRDSKTGIQRVVRGIVNALLEHGAPGYRVEFVHAALGQPYRHAHNYVSRIQGDSPPGIVDTIAEPRAGEIFLGVDFQSIVV